MHIYISQRGEIAHLCNENEEENIIYKSNIHMSQSEKKTEK